jgi:hypothetical protein
VRISRRPDPDAEGSRGPGHRNGESGHHFSRHLDSGGARFRVVRVDESDARGRIIKPSAKALDMFNVAGGGILAGVLGDRRIRTAQKPSKRLEPIDDTETRDTAARTEFKGDTDDRALDCLDRGGQAGLNGCVTRLNEMTQDRLEVVHVWPAT